MINGAGCALDGSVLVLNKFFMAVHVISVRRAFCLLFKQQFPGDGFSSEKTLVLISHFADPSCIMLL